jgi:hypothetical protein
MKILEFGIGNLESVKNLKTGIEENDEYVQ